MRGHSQAEQRAGAVPHGQRAGRGHLSRPAGGGRRLPAQALLPRAAHRPGQEPAAALPGVSGQERTRGGRMAGARAAAHQPHL